jgi:hypothetical protein
MAKKKFVVGDWWITRNGNKVMVWIVHQYSEGFYPRPITCVFYNGGSAQWRENGRWSVDEKHKADLMKLCTPPPEFRRRR